MSSWRRTGGWLLDLSLVGVVGALIGLAPRGGGDAEETSPLRQDPGLALEAAWMAMRRAPAPGETPPAAGDLSGEQAGRKYASRLAPVEPSGPDIAVRITADDATSPTARSGDGTRPASVCASAIDFNASVPSWIDRANRGHARPVLVKPDLKGDDGDALRVRRFLSEVGVARQAGRLTQEEADALVCWGNLLWLSVVRP